MQALRIRPGLTLLLVGGLAVLAGGAHAQSDEAAGSAADAALDSGDTVGADAETARNGNGNCANRFGRDFARAFRRDANDEPLDPDNFDLQLTPQAEPIDAC